MSVIDIVMVDFLAAWHSHFDQLDPVLEALASEYASKIKFVKGSTPGKTSTPLVRSISSHSLSGIVAEGYETRIDFGKSPSVNVDLSILNAYSLLVTLVLAVATRRRRSF